MAPEITVQDAFATPEVTAVRRRTITLLSAAQILSGLAAGAVVSVGSLMAVKLTSSNAWAGSVSTASTLGAALSSLALARLAASHGRRISLVTGLGLASLGATSIVLSSVWSSFALLLLGGALMGVGNAANLQARFAATDLSTVRTRARDLALVVWMSTAGAVTGPNLIRLGAPLSRLTGLPELGAVFLFPLVGMFGAMLVMLLGLRPDPLLTSRRLLGDADVGHARKHVPISVAFATLRRHPVALAAVSGILVAHAVMVGVMSMTPVHMAGYGASISIVGLTVSLHIAGMYALSPVMGLLADRLGSPAVLIGGLGTVLVATVLTGLGGDSTMTVTVGLVLLGLGWSAATVAASSIIAATVTGVERVAVQGLSDSLMSLAGAGGGALAGVVLAGSGYSGLSAAGGALAVAGIIAYWALSRLRVPLGEAS
ncbi:MAG TPA: MFS transporter [Propionibacteriaceae bacterium]|nr:MFS transporter [Propionibacteriaceae bacterium]